MNESAPPSKAKTPALDQLSSGNAPQETKPSDAHTPARWFRATSASSIGIEIAIAVCVPTLIGRWADAKWPQIAPFGIIFGLVVGCGGAARAVQRALADYKRELKNPNRPDESLFVPGSMGHLLHKAGQAPGSDPDKDQTKRPEDQK